MASQKALTILLMVASCLLILSYNPTSARVLKCCEAAKELKHTKIPPYLHRSFICLMKHESNFKTHEKTGPGHLSSYAYGILQIRSDKYCSAYRRGGICNKKCDDFLDENIQDDIACAKLIQEKEGLKYWKSLPQCKDINTLPNLSNCVTKSAKTRYRRYVLSNILRIPRRSMSCWWFVIKDFFVHLRTCVKEQI